MPARHPIAKACAAALILAIAVLTVGLTAASDGPFSITIHAVFVRLAIDVDVKVGTMHLHAGWSALAQDPLAEGTRSATGWDPWR